MSDAIRPSDQPPVDPPPPEGLQHPSVRFEQTDLRFGWIFGILVGSAVLGAIIFVVVLAFFYHYRDYQASIKKSNYPLAPSAVQPLPAQPRLEQVNRMAGIEKGNVFLRQESKEGTLDSYGAAGDGYVHIPIDRAMDYLADKLPVRAVQPAADQARRQNGLVDGGASNSGRMFRGGHE